MPWGVQRYVPRINYLTLTLRCQVAIDDSLDVTLSYYVTVAISPFSSPGYTT